MTLPLHIIWSGSPEIFSSGIFQFRWYTVLLVLAVITARFLFMRGLESSGVQKKSAQSYFLVLLISSLLLARIVYVLGFDFSILKNRPWQLLLPFSFKGGFRFLGTQVFSMPGALAGILVGIWIIKRFLKSSLSFTALVIQALIPFLLIMFLVRVGDFFNSEGYGLPTESKAGVVFASPVERGMMRVPCCVMRTPDGENPLTKVVAEKGNTLIHHQTGFKPVILYLWYKPGSNEQLVREFLIGDVKAYLFDRKDHFYEPGDDALHYTVFLEADNSYIARVQTVGIARHAVQIYEALTFLLLFVIFYRRRNELMVRDAAGIILFVFTTIHFVMEFLRDGKFMKNFPLHTEQLITIPFIVAGLILIITARKTKNQ
jgi:prolipoprotein diacylglyceryltransferase